LASNSSGASKKELSFKKGTGEAEPEGRLNNKGKKRTDAHLWAIYACLFFSLNSNPLGKTRIQSPKIKIARCVKWIYYANPARD